MPDVDSGFGHPLVWEQGTGIPTSSEYDGLMHGETSDASWVQGYMSAEIEGQDRLLKTEQDNNWGIEIL